MPEKNFPLTGLFIVSSIFGGIIIALFDMGQTEVQPTVLMILVFTGVAGFLKSDLAYLWALIIGISIFLVNLLAVYSGHTFTHPVEPNIYATLIALIPAFVGAYTGVFLKWLNGKINKRVNKNKLPG